MDEIQDRRPVTVDSSGACNGAAPDCVDLVDQQAFMKSVRSRAPARTAEEVRAAFERFVVSKERITSDLKRMTIAELTPLAKPLFTGKKKAELIDMAWKNLVDEFAWLTVGAEVFLTKTHEIFSGTARDELADTRSRLAALTDDKLATYLDARDARMSRHKADLLAKVSGSVPSSQAASAS